MCSMSQVVSCMPCKKKKSDDGVNAVKLLVVEHNSSCNLVLHCYIDMH